MAVEWRPTNTNIGALLGNLVDNTAHLVRQEINLVKAEVKEQITETASTTGKAVGLLAAGGLFALVALAFLGMTAIFALNQLMAWPLWQAALVITLVYLAMGALLAFLGWRLLKAATAEARNLLMDQSEKPPTDGEQSPEAIRQDIEATRRQIQADLETLRAEVGSLATLAPVRERIEANPRPWAAGAAGLALLLRALWRRQPAAPPPSALPQQTALPPARESEPAVILHVLQPVEAQPATAEDFSSEKRSIILGLLMIEGVRWLQHYLAQRSAAEAERTLQAAPLSLRQREGGAQTFDTIALPSSRDEVEPPLWQPEARPRLLEEGLQDDRFHQQTRPHHFGSSRSQPE